MSTKKVLAAAGALALGLTPTAALAHTNSLGYVGDGNGSVTFWYGSWHSGTNFTEGSMTLQGVNGNTFAPTTVNWTLLQNTEPTGLIPGTNYFMSDGVNLIPYGDPAALYGSTQSYTWQGVTFTGLAAGDYQFTYNPIAQPTMDWDPSSQVIRTGTVTLSAGLLSGDANLNGILDIYETGGTPPPPTLVSSALTYNVVASVAAPTFTSNTVITHTSSEGGGKQTLNFDAATTVTATTVTTTTTTPVTTDTYSDNSTVITNGTPVVTTTSSSQSAVSHQYADFSGRIDQLEVLGGVDAVLNGFLIHEPITNHKKRFRIFENNRIGKSYNADGYEAKSTIFGGGFEYDLTKGWTAGAHYNDIYSEMVGVDSISHSKRQHVGLFNSFHGRDLALVTNAGGSKDNYDYARTLQYQFGNWGKTEGQQWWVHNRLYANNSGWIRPFLGHTVTNVKRNAYTETGSPESARSVAAYANTTHVGEAGLKVETRFGGKKRDLFGVSLEGSYGTDNSYGVVAEVDYKEVISIEATHGAADGITSNSISGKIKFRF
jgi:hypothetical protein